MRAAMASNLASIALVKRGKVDSDSDERSTEKFPARNEGYSSEFATGSIDTDRTDRRSGEMDRTYFLRTWKLDAMAHEEISLDSMRSLFRLLDEDGGGSLSAEEIKKGMRLLGFKEADDPVALGRLIQNMDEDQTGTVSESEFLSFMGNESRDSLKKKLCSWSLQYTYCRATRYHTRGALNVEVADISNACLDSFVSDALSASNPHTSWLDVVGYDHHTFTELARALGVTHDELADTLLFSEPRCTTLDGLHACAVSLTVHHAKLSIEPVPIKSGSLFPRQLQPLVEFLVGSDIVRAPKILRSRRLADKDAVSGIVVSLEQSSLLVVSEKLVVTFRLPCVEMLAAQLAPFKASLDTNPAAKPAWASFHDASAGRSANPFASDASSVRARFDRIRRWLPGSKVHAVVREHDPSPKHHRRSAEGQFNGDAKFLAVLLVDSLIGSNYDIRDRMQDWDELLEASIRGKQCSANTIHLQAMDTVVANFKTVLHPLADALNPERWAAAAAAAAGVTVAAGATADAEGRDIGVVAEAFAGADVMSVQDFDAAGPALASCRDSGSTPLTAVAEGGGDSSVHRRRSGGDEDAVGSALDTVRSSPRTRDLCVIFRNELPFFKELATDIGNLADGMDLRRDRVQEMSTLLNQLKQDMMNRTLYALTLVTFLATPIMLLTGTFGMNFSDMHELDPTNPDHPEFAMMGYKFYAGAATAVTCSLLLLLYRFGLFAALT